MVTQIASASAVASRITTRSMIVANHEPMYWVARLSSAAGSSQAPFSTAVCPRPIEIAYDMIT